MSMLSMKENGDIPSGPVAFCLLGKCTFFMTSIPYERLVHTCIILISDICERFIAGVSPLGCSEMFRLTL